MTHYDCFNGDADGICSLQQLRLAGPLESILVTGVKRDIALLDRVAGGAGDAVTALDISLDKNRQALLRLLAAGVNVNYFDHHFAGQIPDHPLLDCHVETLSGRGTSLLVDEHLDGRHRAWAVVGTFGDNFDAAARRAADPLGLDEPSLERLRELGIYLNYNGYGETVADLYFPPDALYRRLSPYEDPLAFVAEDATFATLRDGYAADMDLARSLRAELETAAHAVYVLPPKPWARRVGGALANELARSAPGRAHALLTRLTAGGFLVSVRAPLDRPHGADELCRQFATGGGRKAAAGIDRLSEGDYDRFASAFLAAFG